MSVRVLLLTRNSKRSINLLRITGNRCCRRERWQKTYFYLFIIIIITIFSCLFRGIFVSLLVVFTQNSERFLCSHCVARVCGRRDNIFDQVSYRFRRRTDVLRVHRIIKYYRETCFLHSFFFFNTFLTSKYLPLNCGVSEFWKFL